MAAPPLTPPAHDADLTGREVDDLLGIVRRLTVEIDAAEVGLAAARTRRVRAFRELRRHGVTRSVIASAGGCTEGAVGNLIKDLEKREAHTPAG